MDNIDRVTAQDFHHRMTPGGNALLVCAYEDEGSFKLSRLKGAISNSEYLSRRGTLARNTEIVFY